MTQQRRHERFETDIPVRLYVDGKNGPDFEAFGRLRDLSLGGVFVKTGVHFRHLEQVVIELQLPDAKLPISSRVVRQPDGGIGLAFDSLTLKDRERLLKHFVPEQHRRFFAAANVPGVLPGIPVEQMSLLLHLWQDWLDHPGSFQALPTPTGPTARATAPARSSTPAGKAPIATTVPSRLPHKAAATGHAPVVAKGAKPLPRPAVKPVVAKKPVARGKRR